MVRSGVSQPTKEVLNFSSFFSSPSFPLPPFSGRHLKRIDNNALIRWSYSAFESSLILSARPSSQTLLVYGLGGTVRTVMVIKVIWTWRYLLSFSPFLLFPPPPSTCVPDDVVTTVFFGLLITKGRSLRISSSFSPTDLSLFSPSFLFFSLPFFSEKIFLLPPLGPPGGYRKPKEHGR